MYGLHARLTRHCTKASTPLDLCMHYGNVSTVQKGNSQTTWPCMLQITLVNARLPKRNCQNMPGVPIAAKANRQRIDFPACSRRLGLVRGNRCAPPTRHRASSQSPSPLIRRASLSCRWRTDLEITQRLHGESSLAHMSKPPIPGGEGGLWPSLTSPMCQSRRFDLLVHLPGAQRHSTSDFCCVLAHAP
ncbi:hypothetical protein LX36DRAFT_191823 [Colletotrichum falcatum]|nr:hypothetical protein LX36DRAFT_191823 [Colletotrichum falcatum]